MAAKTYRVATVAVSLFSLILLFSNQAHAETITVDDDLSADFNNIQAAIDSAGHGDTIIVYPGTYVENINFNGKNITLSSTNPNDPNEVAATIIDGGQNGSVVTFENGEDANCVLDGFTVTNGYSEQGGGIYCSGPLIPPQPPPPPPLPIPPPSEPNFTSPTITHCIISDNSGGDGGGMYNYNSNPTLSNCTFIGNRADSGGGMYNDSSWAGQIGPILTNCTFTDNLAAGGGGMFNFNSIPTLINCTLSNNWADYKGGGAYNILCISTMTGCIFNGNSAYDDGGGGLYNVQSNLTLANCTFTDNSAKEGMGPGEVSIGGAIFNDNSSLNMTNCAFNENSSDRGGGMYNGQSTLTLINCTFTNNSVMEGMDPRSLNSGGAIFNDNSSSNMTNCAFNENSAEYGNGGAIFNDNSSLSLTNCAFNGNLTDYGNGGGIYNRNSNATMTGCTFNGNSAESGAGISNIYNSNLTMINSMFSGNSSSLGSGIYNYGSNTILNNCMFTGNYAYNSGGGIYNNNGITMLANCILWENVAEYVMDEPAQIYGQPVIVDYSCIQGWTGTLGGTGNIGDDPCFVLPGHFSPDPNCALIPFYPYCFYDWTGGDYHLSPDSPCINAGDPNYVAGPNETDLDGNPRVIDGRIDMGAYEYISPVPAEVKITPHTISLESSGKSITAYLWLPEGFEIIDLADIDPNGVLLEYQIQPEQLWFNEQKQMVISRFSREKVQALLKIGQVELTINVRLADGTIFLGTDIISVKSKVKPDRYVQATEPDPPDGATGVNTTADLSWTPAPEATSRDVYFGTSNPPPFIGNQTSTIFDPGTMDYETTYYWRIDEINKWGTTTGQIWSFTTFRKPPQPPPPIPPM